LSQNLPRAVVELPIDIQTLHDTLDLAYGCDLLNSIANLPSVTCKNRLRKANLVAPSYSDFSNYFYLLANGTLVALDMDNFDMKEEQ
jgi:hypothetical protein